MTFRRYLLQCTIILLYVFFVQDVYPIKFIRKLDQKRYVGYILFRREQNGITYLILKPEGQDKWILPEGRVRFGETRQKAVKRILREITGLLSDDVTLGITERMFEPENRTTYWIACLANDEKPIKLHHQFLEYKWSSFEEACELTNPLSKQLLEQSQPYINNQ